MIYFISFQFLTLYRNLEKAQFTEKNVKDLFFAEADVIKTETGFFFWNQCEFIFFKGERAISFKKFVSLVTEKNLFTSEKQRRFAEDVQTYAEVQAI